MAPGTVSVISATGIAALRQRIHGLQHVVRVVGAQHRDHTTEVRRFHTKLFVDHGKYLSGVKGPRVQGFDARFWTLDARYLIANAWCWAFVFIQDPASSIEHLS